MEIRVFKTSVNDLKEVNAITQTLNNVLGPNVWNFDLEDCDNIFRLENGNIHSFHIIELFSQLGHDCIELN